MSKLTHRVPADIKADIMRRVKEEGIPVAQAAKEHGLHESTIYNITDKIHLSKFSNVSFVAPTPWNVCLEG